MRENGTTTWPHRDDGDFIPYGQQSISEDDIAAVVAVLKSDYLTCGPKVDEFERALADYCGAKHAIAVCNGTAALHVAMLAAGVGPGDRVLTSAITFLASANGAEFVGATADFADIDPVMYNVTAETLAAAWKPDVKAIVPVDFAGLPCDMPAIAALARSRGATIIEDASHAIGSQFEYGGRWYKVGGHPWADMTTFSFHPVKTITSGEGGAILTDDDRLAERCRLFRSHGMVRGKGEDLDLDAACPLTAEHGPWYYEMRELGYNYRITDIQCALGLSQLREVDAFVRRRQAIAMFYHRELAQLEGVKTPSDQIAGMAISPAWHLYVLQVDFAAIGKTRSDVFGQLRERRVGAQVHYIPVYLQPYYLKRHGYRMGKCPAAEAYYRRCLSVPLFPAMTDADVDRVVQIIRHVIRSCGSVRNHGTVGATSEVRP